MKTVSTANLLPINGGGGAAGDTISLASSTTSPRSVLENGIDSMAAKGASGGAASGELRERCPTCGKFNASDDDEDVVDATIVRKNSDSEDDCITMQVRRQESEEPADAKLKTTSYLMAVHRNLCRQDTYFLSHHKSRPGLFGVPLLIPCFEGVTNKELYCAVWTQVSRLLSKLPPTPPDQANHATDWLVF